MYKLSPNETLIDESDIKLLDEDTNTIVNVNVKLLWNKRIRKYDTVAEIIKLGE